MDKEQQTKDEIEELDKTIKLLEDANDKIKKYVFKFIDEYDEKKKYQGNFGWEGDSHDFYLENYRLLGQKEIDDYLDKIQNIRTKIESKINELIEDKKSKQNFLDRLKTEVDNTVRKAQNMFK